MPNTAEQYRQQQLLEFRTQRNAKIAAQHVEREGEVPINGNKEMFNLGDIMVSNIMDSRYFFNVLDLQTFEDVLDEIKREVHDLEPLVIGTSRHPSSAFCILFKLSKVQITFQELNQMIHSTESPFIRGIGFLYIRFAIPPRDLWKYLAPYLDDPMPITPYSDKIPTTIGKFVTSLIQQKKYQDLMLPPIPVVAKREFDINLLKLETLNNRDYRGEVHSGDSVMSFYSVDLKWYPAKILTEKFGCFYVQYDVYNNKEMRTRGHILAQGEDPNTILAKPLDKQSRSRSRDRSRDRSHSHHHHHHRHERSRSRSRDRSRDISHDTLFDDKKLAELVRERERSAAVSDGRVSNVSHVKQSLMMKMDRFTARKQEREPERNVIVNKIEAEDSLAKVRLEEERKKKEMQRQRKLDAIQMLYTKKESDEDD